MKMSNDSNHTNCVNGSCDIRGAAASHGRVGVCGQALPGRHPATDHTRNQEDGRSATLKRRKWTTDENRMLMRYYYESEPEKRGYRQRLYRLWRSSGLGEASEQRLSDQVRTILKHRWFSQLELEEIRTGKEESSAEDNHTEREMEESLETFGAPVNTETNQTVRRSGNHSEIRKYMVPSGSRDKLPPLRNMDRKKLCEVTRLINMEAAEIQTTNITETNMLIYACARLAMDKLEVKIKANSKGGRQHAEAPWKRRIKNNIEKTRAHLAKFIAFKNNCMKRNKERQWIEDKCAREKKKRSSGATYGTSQSNTMIRQSG